MHTCHLRKCHRKEHDIVAVETPNFHSESCHANVYTYILQAECHTLGHSVITPRSTLPEATTKSEGSREAWVALTTRKRIFFVKKLRRVRANMQAKAWSPKQQCNAHFMASVPSICKHTVEARGSKPGHFSTTVLYKMIGVVKLYKARTFFHHCLVQNDWAVKLYKAAATAK